MPVSNLETAVYTVVHQAYGTGRRLVVTNRTGRPGPICSDWQRPVLAQQRSSKCTNEHRINLARRLDGYLAVCRASFALGAFAGHLTMQGYDLQAVRHAL
jgi:hypothetical protein